MGFSPTWTRLSLSPSRYGQGRDPEDCRHKVGWGRLYHPAWARRASPVGPTGLGSVVRRLVPVPLAAMSLAERRGAVLNQPSIREHQGASGIKIRDWGHQGSLISGSQAPLGTQGTSEISGISLNQDQGWGYQVLALISLIQHSSDNGTCWPLLPVPSTSAAAATARCCCMTRVGAPRVCVAQHRRRQHGPPRPAPAPRRAWPKQRRTR